jgi:aminoglycoside phosphotransferase (APT) family kinase protein
VVEEYGRLTGRDVSGMLFYYCFALFKIAVIAQQIYKRYVEGLTHDERFAALGVGVQLLARAAVEAADRGSF